MAKRNKKTIRLIIASGVLAVLTVVLVLLLVFSSGNGGGATSSGAASSDNSITLVSKKQADVKNIHIKNKNGEYDIALIGDKEWAIKALSAFEQKTDLYSLAVNEVATVKADSILSDTQKDLARYGLDKPATVVTATFVDGTTFEMNIGAKDPVSYGNYITVKGKDPIYIYAGASYFEYDINDYVATQIFDIKAPIMTVSTESGPTTQEGALVLDKMEIERADLKKPITFVKVENVSSEEMGGMTFTYQMTSPRDIYIDDTKLDTVITGFTSMDSSGVEVINPTAAQLKERGFDRPFATVRIFYEGKSYTLKIGKPITCESTDDMDALESGHVHTVSGYNVMRDGTNLIYNVLESSLPWLSVKPEDMMSSLAVFPNIADVKTVTINLDGKTHTFTVNKSTTTNEDGTKKDVYAPVYNGTKALTEAYFKSFYQVLLNVYQTGINYKDDVGKPELTIQYHYLNSNRKSDKLEFYNNGGDYIMSVNGNKAFLTRLSYINNVKAATAQIIENKKVVTNS